jgi:hypothetical protein
MVKWAPFNAVASGTFMVNEVVNEKSKTMMPILSDDQKLYLQEKMIEAFNNGEYVKIKYFKKGTYYIIEGFITNIDQISRKFTINKEFSIFFSQIIEFL